MRPNSLVQMLLAEGLFEAVTSQSPAPLKVSDTQPGEGRLL